jgi:hypothetical protein
MASTESVGKSRAAGNALQRRAALLLWIVVNTAAAAPIGIATATLMLTRHLRAPETHQRLPAALVCRRDDSEQLSALPQHAAVGLKTLGNDGNCCIVEAPPLGFETAVPVPPGATVAPGAVAVTDSWPTPVQGRPVSEFLPSAGWIKVLGSAGGTESWLRAERTVLFPLSTGLTVFPPSIEAPVFCASDKVVVAVRTRTLRPISSTRLAAMGRSPIRPPQTLNG